MSSSVGTLIEWYDFYIFGSLATIIAAKFFPADNPTAALLSTLATFAAGFIVRPFGALFFGRLGDLIGRKYTFLVTLVLMGGATFLIGCIPDYSKIGALAPILILILRLLQGLALGGEYGGAATYVAEHAPAGERGFWTSWIQTTATLGLFVSLMVIIFTKESLGAEKFEDWGWRVPFLLSIFLVIVSIIIRMRMKESPMFAKLKDEGNVSTNPLKESFGNKANFKMVLLVLFGATMGQGVVWYTGQFYAQLFLLNTCKVDATQVNTWLCVALLLGTGGFVLFGWLSDKIGRKVIMMMGMALAIVCTKPLFKRMFAYASPAHKTEITEKATSEVKMALAPKSTTDSLKTTKTVKFYTDGTSVTDTKKETIFADTASAAAKAYKAPAAAKVVKLGESNKWPIIWSIVCLVLFVTMVYGPIAAFLVELFPTKIRYTSMSLPYHIGNGVFGGLVPLIGTLMTEATKTKELPGGDPFAGLAYPMTIAMLCLLIGTMLLPKNVNHMDNPEG
jgi:MHS family proline/betaine transporter-like MFS transporter